MAADAPNSRIVALWLDAKAVVNRSTNPLFAAEIPLSRLHGNVPEEELNLLEFAAGGATKPSATSTETMRREFANADLGGELLDDVPDQLFRHSVAPYLAGAAHTPKETTGLDYSRRGPVIQKASYPIWDGDGSNVTSLPT